MLTNSKVLDYLIWSVLRCIIYQYIFIFAITNLSDLPKSSLEFIEKLQEFCAISQREYPKFIPNYVIDFMPIYQKFMYVLLVFASLATLGLKVFQFISGVSVIVLAIIFYHPLKKSTLKEGEDFTTYNQKYPWIDTVITSIFGLVMIYNSLFTFPEWLLKDPNSNKIVYLEEDAEEFEKAEKEKKLKEKKKN